MADDLPGLTPSEGDYDLIAEQSTVGAMLLNPSIIDDVTDELTPSDFWSPKHEVIARAIVALHQQDLPTDVVSVTEDLTRAGTLREAGGAAYLHELTSVPPTSANAGYYAAIVHRKAVKRRLAVAGHRIAQMGQASEGDLEELIERARRELDAVPTGRRTQPKRIGDTLDDIVDSLGSKPTYMRTPWEALDKVIGGFSRGQLVVFAGRPGGGKSIAVLQIATRLAHEGIVAFSSLEMTAEELGTRLISQYGTVSMRSLRDRTLTDMDKRHIAEASKVIKGAPLFIDATGDATVAQIRAHARSVARGGNLVCVVVDYLQLVSGDGENREQRVASVSKGLKQLAKELDVVVIAAAQLKRLSARRPSEIPTLEDLRESGSIEQDADIVILLHRDPKKPKDLVMVVAKNRHGVTKRFSLDWDAEYSRLKDQKWRPTALLDDDEVA